jgi:hypothetical protein
MTPELLAFTSTKVDELLAAASSSKQTRDAAQAWKDAKASGADMDIATTTLLDAIDKHHTTVEELIAFANGAAKDVLGAAAAAKMYEHGLELKAKGDKYCDCAACVAARPLLAKHGRPVL